MRVKVHEHSRQPGRRQVRPGYTVLAYPAGGSGQIDPQDRGCATWNDETVEQAPGAPDGRIGNGRFRALTPGGGEATHPL